MSAPLIYSGRRAKLLTQDGLLRPDGSIIDNNGTPNLVKNGHAEINVTGWTVSKNTVAASRPDSGFVTSSTNITWTRNTTNPIDGQADFLYTKGAANRQGEQVYCGFTVAKKYRAKVLQIEVDYLVNSGTFSAGSSSTDSDVIVYIYDVTNSTFIEPSSFKFLSNSSTIADKFVANFQTSATGSSYRILFHQATTSTSAFAVQFKEIRISPCQYVYGTPISDWISWTPTGSLTTNTTYSGKRRRVGDNEELRIKADFSGTNTQGAMTINLPVTIDTAKIPGTVNGATVFGYGAVRDTGSADFDVVAAYNSTTSLTVLLKNSSATYGYYAQVNTSTNVPMTVANGDSVEVFVSVPVVGYSSSVQQSDGYDGRQISAKVARATVQALTDGNELKVQFNTVLDDKTASYDNVTNYRYTAPTSGDFEFDGYLSMQGTSGTGSAYVALYKNGSGVSYSHTGKTGTGTATWGMPFRFKAENVKAGDYFEIYAQQNTGGSVNVLGSDSVSQGSVLNIKKLQAPTTISATERVSASYNTSAGQSISTSTVTIVDFGTKLEDSHGAVTTGASWKFVAPVAGEYQVNTGVLIAGGNSLPAGNECNLALLKNGTDYKVLAAHYGQTASTASISLTGAAKVKLNAGEYFDIRVYQTTGSTSTLINQSRFNYVDVFLVK